MNIISRKAHGVLDYIVGLLLILAPRLLGLEPSAAESNVPVALGWATIIYSLLTRYELGLLKLIPFRGHLALDVMSGLVLAASPWLFGFADRVWLPHLLLGLLELGAVMMTRRTDTVDHAHIGGTPAHH